MLVELSSAEVGQLQSIRDELGPHVELRQVLACCIAAAASAAPDVAALRGGGSLVSDETQTSPAPSALDRGTSGEHFQLPGFVIERLRVIVDAAAVGKMTIDQAHFAREWFRFVEVAASIQGAQSS